MAEESPGASRATTGSSGAGRLDELRVSARGWHGVQLAVLGFIGLCGVLRPDGSHGQPHWLQVLSGILVLVAFGLACTATALVAVAAWPVYAPDRQAESEAEATSRTSSRLRAGIVLTYVAVAILALATSSAWWPHPTADAGGTGSVDVRTQGGEVCGELRASRDEGVLALSSGGQLVRVIMGQVVSIRPVNRCT